MRLLTGQSREKALRVQEPTPDKSPLLSKCRSVHCYLAVERHWFALSKDCEQVQRSRHSAYPSHPIPRLLSTCRYPVNTKTYH